MNDLLDLAATWDRTSGARHARANQLGNCRAGEVLAAEAVILRDCADELRTALTAALGAKDSGMHEHDGYAPHSHEVRADHGGVKRESAASETDQREALIHDLAIVLGGCLHRSAQIGPGPRLAAHRIRDVLGITPGELTAGVEDRLADALGQPEDAR